MGWPFAGVTSGYSMSTTIFFAFVTCVASVLLWGAYMWWRYRWCEPASAEPDSRTDFSDVEIPELHFSDDGRREPAGLGDEPELTPRIRFKDPLDSDPHFNVAHRPNPNSKPKQEKPPSSRKKVGPRKYSFGVSPKDEAPSKSKRVDADAHKTPQEGQKARKPLRQEPDDIDDTSRAWPPVPDLPRPPEKKVAKVPTPRKVPASYKVPASHNAPAPKRALEAGPPAKRPARPVPPTAVSAVPAEGASPPPRRGQNLRQILEPLGGKRGSITVGQQIVVRSLLGRPAPEWMSDTQAATLLSVRFCCEHLLAGVMGGYGDTDVDPIVLRRLTVLVVADKQAREQVVQWDAQRTLNSDGNPVFRQRDPKTVRMIERLARRLLDEGNPDVGPGSPSPGGPGSVSASGSVL